MPRSSTSLAREIRSIRASFRQIARSFGRIAPLLTEVAPTADRAAGSNGGRRKPRLSTDQRRALKLQGQYMGHLRGLKPRQKARVKALRAAKGIKPAIAFARRLARR